MMNHRRSIRLPRTIWNNSRLMSMHFDMVDFRLMVHIADANSMTRGAELSRISLPAASTRIKNLEEGIGAKLLYRTSQGVTLTPPGQAFVMHARSVLEQLEHLRGDLQEYASGIKGHLRVFANTTALGEFLPPVLRSYLLTHPGVNIDLRERVSHDIVRAVSEGQTDIGIVAGMVRTESLETIPYRRDHLVLVVPQSHELASKSVLRFADTLDYDHVGLHESTAIHAFLRGECDQLHRASFGFHFERIELLVILDDALGPFDISLDKAAHRLADAVLGQTTHLADQGAKPVEILVEGFECMSLGGHDLPFSRSGR
jgi:DNA-binding transcriptional LysR family regulator